MQNLRRSGTLSLNTKLSANYAQIQTLVLIGQDKKDHCCKHKIYQ